MPRPRPYPPDYCNEDELRAFIRETVKIPHVISDTLKYRDRIGTVYVASGDSVRKCKIGFSKSYKQRISTYKTYDQQIEMMFFGDVAHCKQIERICHNFLSHCRIDGKEWFMIDAYNACRVVNRLFLDINSATEENMKAVLFYLLGEYLFQNSTKFKPESYYQARDLSNLARELFEKEFPHPDAYPISILQAASGFKRKRRNA